MLNFDKKRKEITLSVLAEKKDSKGAVKSRYQYLLRLNEDLADIFISHFTKMAGGMSNRAVFKYGASNYLFKRVQNFIVGSVYIQGYTSDFTIRMTPKAFLNKLNEYYKLMAWVDPEEEEKVEEAPAPVEPKGEEAQEDVQEKVEEAQKDVPEKVQEEKVETDKEDVKPKVVKKATPKPKLKAKPRARRTRARKKV